MEVPYRNAHQNQKVITPKQTTTCDTHQRLLQKVDRLRGRLREERRERAAFPDGQRADVVARAARGDAVELLERRRADHVQDQVELVPIVPPGEERPPVQQLGEDAADGPDVDGLQQRKNRKNTCVSGT